VFSYHLRDFRDLQPAMHDGVERYSEEIAGENDRARTQPRHTRHAMTVLVTG
jgi:hypothetical protein